MFLDYQRDWSKLVELLFLKPNYFFKSSLYFVKNTKRREYMHFSYNLLKKEVEGLLFYRYESLLQFWVPPEIPSWNERLIKNVKICIFWLRLVINFSASDSWTGLVKNDFTTIFHKYVLEGLFAFGILDERFEPTLTKKSLNISAMEFLIVIIFGISHLVRTRKIPIN